MAQTDQAPPPRRIHAVFAIAIAVFAAPAIAAEITGPARVIDGATVEIAGRSIQLAGIGAPAEAELCGARRCGQDSSWALAARIERHWTTCDAQEDGGAVCYIGGRNGINLNQWAVREGWAWACTDALTQLEGEARAAGRGLWATAAAPPNRRC